MTGPARIRVVAAVITRGDRYLVCQRPAHKRHGGLWEFPGGKCEPAEDDSDAVAREIEEELGVPVLLVHHPVFVTGDPESPFDIVFIPTLIGGEPRALEHEAIGWFDRDTLRTMPLAPSDAAFVASLGATDDR